MIILGPKDKLTFGKNKALTLAEVYQYQPSYIEWAIENVDYFIIDPNEFHKLPPPSTFEYNPKRFSGKHLKLEPTFENLLHLIEKSDTGNTFVNVETIKEMISQGHRPKLLVNFRFPDYILKLNEDKISRFNV